MNQERELLSEAAERLCRHGQVMADLLLGDKIYKHLYATDGQEKLTGDAKLEQED